MSNPLETIERLQGLVEHLDDDQFSELKATVLDVRAEVAKQVDETVLLAKAQADAIVHSAEVIAELEATKESLEESQRQAEIAKDKALKLSAFGDILDQSQNEIYIFDASTLRFIHVNHGACENTGYSLEELKFKTPADISVNRKITVFAEFLKPLRDGSVKSLDFSSEHQRKDGSVYPVEFHLENSWFGGKQVIAAVALDVTERRQLEKELRQSKENAIAADKAKSEFLANMSHEIRTPMTAILGYSDVLLEEDISSTEKLEAIQTIRRNGNHLLEIINDILDLSKVESGKLEIERRRIEPMDLLNDVGLLLGDRAKSLGNKLAMESTGQIPQTITTDPTRLKQTLVNLVGNAIKFTKNGTVRVVASCSRKDETITFDVIDTGIGITKEQLSRIFKPFGQADSSTTRKHGGTGLGLSITKRIAELLGGNVTVESVIDKGSTFSLTISTGSLTGVQLLSSNGFVPQSASSEQHPSAKPVGKLNGKVLLVEDGPDNQRLVSHVLRKAGAKVTIAENGKIGVEQALSAWESDDPYGVILMDMQMPVMDGYTATGLLRSKGYFGPIIALTAHAMKGEIDKCLNAGCDAYLSKPIDRKTFISEVASRMQTSQKMTTPTLSSN